MTLELLRTGGGGFVLFTDDLRVKRVPPGMVIHTPMDVNEILKRINSILPTDTLKNTKHLQNLRNNNKNHNEPDKEVGLGETVGLLRILPSGDTCTTIG